MDSITQAVLGAAVGEVVLGKHLGNRALVWGAVFGTLPDLDVLFSPFLDTAGKLIHHRGASHSLLVMIIASFVLARWLPRLWKREKVTKARAGWFVFLVWSTHVLIDCFTVYGTSVLWPFSDRRIAFNHIFIIDPFYTLPLIVSVIWLAFLRDKKRRPKRRRICYWGLGISSGYIALSLFAKWLASTGFDADLHRRGITYARRMEAPTPFNIILWRSVVDRGDELWVGYRTIFEFRDTPVRWTIYPRGRDAFTTVAATNEAKTIAWFSDGWWIARNNAQGVWLADLRFGETRTWGEREGTVDSRIMFSWIFKPAEKGDRLRQIMQRPKNSSDTLKHIGLRMIGDRKSWEGNPRLAGIHGHLPEILSVEE